MSMYRYGKRKDLRTEVYRLSRLNKDGYQFTSKNRLVHREVYIKAYGFIPKDYVVHHIDENKINNDPSNLIAMPSKLHSRLHYSMKKSRSIPKREDLIKIIKAYEELKKYKSANVQINIYVDVYGSVTDIETKLPIETLKK